MTILRKIQKFVLERQYRNMLLDYYRLKKVPRYHLTNATIDGQLFYIADAASYMEMYEDIIVRQIYCFNSQSNKPYIIDGGANIGLSILYFKKLYPDSNIVAFEPDGNICNILRLNVNNYDLKNVEIIEKALWCRNEERLFCNEGGAGGHLDIAETLSTGHKVKTVRLRDHINRDIDFLKLDIEGAEVKVLEDTRDLLKRVSNIFVEYHCFSGQVQELDVVLEILRSSGFKCYIENAGQKLRQPFVEMIKPSEADLQVNIYGVNYYGG